MSGVVTDFLRIRNSRQFIESVDSGGVYAFIGRPEPWDVESSPPDPAGTIEEQRVVYRSITSFKPVTTNDVCPVTYRFDWTQGTTYKMFMDDLTPDSQEIPEGTFNYYVVVQTGVDVYDVYLCLYNGTGPYDANGVPSTDVPIGRSSIPYVGPNDGYIWKYIYTISSGSIDKHLTDVYLPVEASNIPPVDGEVVCVYPTTSGSGMNTSNSIIPYYYCDVVGDGSGAVIRFSVRDGQIDRFQVIRSGSGYTYANVEANDPHIYASLTDLDNKTNPVIVGGTKPEFRIILPPTGGYTNDIVSLLSAYYVSVNVETKYGYSVSGGDTYFFENMKFRQYGLIENIKLTNGSTPTGSNYLGCFATKVSAGSGNFITGERLYQIQDTGIAYGTVVHWDASSRTLFYIQTQDMSADGKNIIYFSGTDYISGEVSGASGQPDITYSKAETTTGITITNGYCIPHVTTNSGYILYLNNIQPVQRSSTQVESLRFILKF